MMQMVGTFAEFERAMLRERTKAGLDAARKRGRIGGRRPKLRPHQQDEIVAMVSKERKLPPTLPGCSMFIQPLCRDFWHVPIRRWAAQSREQTSDLPLVIGIDRFIWERNRQGGFPGCLQRSHA
jgi:Resolvase, N terminal domain